MNMTELHKKLKSEGIITFNRQYLSQLAGEGKIPYRVGDNGRKVFKYIQVVKALAEGYHVEISNDMEKATITSSKIKLYHWKGKLVKLEHDKKAGILLDRNEVEQKAFEVARVIRDQLLSMPERLTAEIMSADTPDKAEALIRNEIELILEPLTPESFMP